MQFTLLGRQIEISEGRKNYMKVAADFHKMAANAATDFKRDYDDSFTFTFFSSSYAEKVVSKYANGGLNSIVMRYVTEARKYLTTYGVYSVTDEDIYNAITTEYEGDTEVQVTFNAFLSQLRMNLGYDASDSDYVPHIKEKFEQNYFANALQVDIMAMCDYVLDLLSDNQILEMQFVYADDAKTARAYYENLRDGRMPEEERAKLAYAIMDLDPRNLEYYQYIFIHMPAAKYEIARIAAFLSIDLSDLIMRDINGICNLSAIRSEEEALQVKENLDYALAQYGIQDVPVKRELEVLLREYDEKARTYDGYLYETRELRAKAEADDQEMAATYADPTLDKPALLSIAATLDAKPYEERMKDKHIRNIHAKVAKLEAEDMKQILVGLDTATEQDCGEYLAKIREYDAMIAEKDPFFAQIQNRIVTIWNTELQALVQGVEAMTEAQCNEAKEAIFAHIAQEEIKDPYLDQLDKRIEDIWDAEDFQRFTELFKQTPVGDAAAIAQNAAHIQETGRTKNKALFITAIHMLNEAEVTATAKYAIAKESGKLASLFNMGKKDTYMTLTLDGRVIHPAIEAEIQAQKEAKSGGLFGLFKKRK